MRDLQQLVTELVDGGIGMLSTVWPRSVAGREVSRLAREGYRIGVPHACEFTLSFESEHAGAALAAVEAAGVGKGGRVPAKRPCTIRAPMPLSASRLHVPTPRLQRLVAPYGGYAAASGPAERTGRPQLRCSSTAA